MDQTRSPRQRNLTGMSYKFQRLRERVRQAVISGELSGKLPGERELAKRFHVNAKTLSKALTDLAAEGLLERSIGRGTFVKGSEPPRTGQGPWLLICTAEDAESPVARALMRVNPGSQTAHGGAGLRPSFVNQFAGVVDLASDTPDSILRDLIVRNIPVVSMNRRPASYATDAVRIDAPYGAESLARDLLLAGHRRLLAIEARNQTTITTALRRAAARYAPDSAIDTCFPREVCVALDYGATAVVCDSAISAAQTLDLLRQQGLGVPERVSVVAVGSASEPPCTGYFVTPEQEAEAIEQLLRRAPTNQPTTLWLSGRFHDRGTTSPVGDASPGIHGSMPHERTRAVAV